MVVIIDIGYNKLETKYGEFCIDAFYDGDNEAIVLRSAESLASNKMQYCRIQYECFSHYNNIFNLVECCDCELNVSNALSIIKEKGGIFILIKKEKRSLISSFKNNPDPGADLGIVCDLIRYYNTGVRLLKILITVSCLKIKTYSDILPLPI